MIKPKSLALLIDENKHEYEFYQRSDNKSGAIEVQQKDGFVYHIGVWFDKNNRLIDYDGVYILSWNAIKTIRKAGYIVPHEFVKDLKS